MSVLVYLVLLVMMEELKVVCSVCET